jgi:EAL domain-containing protein (putative c-di-GMP-specific phosphodiesterase class I)
VLDGLVDILAALDMRLVVEGIESESQARLVRDLGAGIGQGWHFGRPMSADAAAALIPQQASALRA